MFYFDTLPKIITPDENGNAIVLTNLIARARLIEQLQNNPMIFYEYSIQEGDTPEIVAEKYYGDPYRYWIVLLSNELLNPVWDWPLSEQMFLHYINTKYKTEAEAEDKTPFEYTNTTVYQYRKIVTTKNIESGIENITTLSINLADYNSLVPSTTNYNLPDGLCTVSISKEIITLYDYEQELNESKAQIKLLNASYVADFEAAFRNLMGA